MDYSEIETDIKFKYQNDHNRRALAEKCLEKGKEWVDKRVISSPGGLEECRKLSNDSRYRSKLRKECYAYIRKNVEIREEEKVYGSIIFMIILGAVISWVVKKILDKLFS
jgi:hypothetical protein